MNISRRIFDYRREMLLFIQKADAHESLLPVGESLVLNVCLTVGVKTSE